MPISDPALLLLHGWLADSSVWTSLRRILQAQRRVVCPDLSGTLEADATAAATLMRSLHIERFVAVGHSSGALTAQCLARQAPANVAGLVLLAPVPPSGWNFPPKIDAFMRSLPGNAEQIETWLRGLTRTAPSAEDAILLRQAALRAPVPEALEAYEQWTKADLTEQALAITQPTLLIAPEDDRPMTPTALREAFAPFPNVRMETLAQAGHYAFIDRPQEVAELLETFAATFAGPKAHERFS